MSVSSSTLRRLAELRLDPDQMAGVLGILAEQQEAEESRKAAQRERTRRSRAKRDGNVTDTQLSQESNVEVPPKKETSPTPPKEKTTPSQSEANASSKNLRAVLGVVLDADRSSAVVEHRKRIGKPMTVRAAELLASKFAKCPDPNAAADAMIANGWQGFEPEWVERQQPRGSPPRNHPNQRHDPFKALAEELADEHERSQGSRFSDWDDAQGVPLLTIEHQRR